MKRTVTAVFDGKALLPETRLDLRTNSRYEITIEEVGHLDAASGVTGLNKAVLAPPTAGDRPDAWDELESLTGSVEAPADWAAEHDHYLYGSSKRRG